MTHSGMGVVPILKERHLALFINFRNQRTVRLEKDIAPIRDNKLVHMFKVLYLHNTTSINLFIPLYNHTPPQMAVYGGYDCIAGGGVL